MEPTHIHSFGGRALDRHVFDFETVEAGAADAGLGGLEGTETGGVEPVEPVEPAAVEPVEPVEPAGGISEARLGEMIREGSSSAFQEMLAQAAQQEEQARAEAARAQTPELPAWDPFDPDVVGKHVDARMQPIFERLEQVLGPVLETTERVNAQQGETQAKEILTQHEGVIGKFDHDRALKEAAFLARAGATPEQALEQAAKSQRAFEESIRADERTRLQGKADAISGVQPEPNGLTGAAAEVVEPYRGPDAYKRTLNDSLARMGKRPGVGSPTG